MASSSNAALKPGEPSQQDVQSTTQQGFMSIYIVTAACHAIRNTILHPIADVATTDPDLQQVMKDIQKGFADVSGKLDKAKITADEWLNDLSTEIARTIPTHIIDYNSLYEAASDQILEIIAQAEKDGSTPALIDQMLDLIKALQEQINTNKREIEDAAKRIQDYSKKVQVDHDAMVGGVDIVQQLVVKDQHEADVLKARIDTLQDEVKELNKKLVYAEVGTVGGIFVSIVGLTLCFVPGGQVAGGVVLAVGIAGTVGGATAWGLLQAQINSDYKEIGADQMTKSLIDQQVLSLSALHASVAMVLDQVTTAQTTLSQVGVLWGTFEGILQGVIDDLSKPNANVKLAVDKLWVNAAKKQWQALEAFAQQLVQTPITVENLPTQKPAA
jgi:hypothetical protein